MNCAAHRAEQWVQHHNRLLLSEVEQFLAAPVPILLNRPGLNNLRQPTIGAELRILIDRNAVADGTFLAPPPSSPHFVGAGVTGFPSVKLTGINTVGNPTFATPQPVLRPWLLGSNWALSGNGSAKKTPGTTGALSGSFYLTASKPYLIAFTIRNAALGSVQITSVGGSDVSPVRSGNGTFIQILQSGSSTTFRIVPTADFDGEIADVTIYELLDYVALPQPWVYGAGWSFTGLGSARKVNGSTAALEVLASVITPTITYNVTFTVTNYVSGTITPTVGATAGTARSANGTFTEAIISGAGTAFQMIPNAAFAGDISNVIVTPNTAPGDCTAALYTAPDALAALRSTESWTTITLPSATKTLIRHTRFLEYVNTASAFDVGLILSAAYTVGKVYASVWTRRYWWGQPASPG